MRITHRLVSADGTGLAVWEAGTPDGRPIILLHGFSQSALCFAAQAASPALAEYRLVMPDLRGHGASDKPAAPAAYAEIAPWTEDVTAVIDGLQLDKPVLAGWSHGGRIVCQYLAACGDDRLSAVALIAARLALNPPTHDPAAGALIEAMGDDDLAVSLPATIDFVRMCTAKPLPQDVLLRFVAFNMLVPPFVRRAMRGQPLTTEAAFARLSVPTLIVHGAEDAITAREASEWAHRALPHSTLALYPGVGHAPFAEDPERFNADLAAFVGGLG